MPRAWPRARCRRDPDFRSMMPRCETGSVRRHEPLVLGRPSCPRSWLVAQPRACARQQCAAKDVGTLPHPQAGGKIAVRASVPIRKPPPVSSILSRGRRLISIRFERRLDLQLHRVEQIGPAGNDLRAGGVRVCSRAGALLDEGLHVRHALPAFRAAFRWRSRSGRWCSNRTESRRVRRRPSAADADFRLPRTRRW